MLFFRPITGAGPQEPDPGLGVIRSPLRLIACIRRATPCGDNPPGNQLRQQFPETHDFARPVRRMSVDTILRPFAVVFGVVVAIREISVGHGHSRTVERKTGGERRHQLENQSGSASSLPDKEMPSRYAAAGREISRAGITEPARGNMREVQR
jgi:hypothetical protein